MNVEILLDYNEDVYHNRPELSKSQLDQFLVSPLNYWYNNLSENSTGFEETKSMRIGSMVHKMVLEGSEAFDKAYASPPKDGVKKPTAAQLSAKKPSEKTLEQIKLWEEYEKSTEGKLSPRPDELATAMKCASAVSSHKLASDIISSIEAPEVTIVYDAFGQPMRSRLDGITKGGAVVDLKTTQDASPQEFKRSFYKYNYGLQKYVYSLAYYKAYNQWPKEFYFVVEETKPPFHTAVYTIPDSSDEYWKKVFEDSIRKFIWCRTNDTWPGINEDMISVLPV
jgi:hypothetical protein